MGERPNFVCRGSLIDIRIWRGLGIKASIRGGMLVSFHKSNAVRACFGKAARAAILFLCSIAVGLLRALFRVRQNEIPQ
jgi:hypothetical protein